MKKFLAVAALVATSFAVPVMPAQAAAVLSDAQANCLIFPVFKKECWDMGAKAVVAAPKAVAAVAEDAADAAGDIKLPVKWWNCTAAAKGSGHLLDC